MEPRDSNVADVDVVVVGGGPAGLSAALVLGRACKKVLLCDAGPRRNAKAEHIHGFVTRDGTPPAEFRGLAREQLGPYDVTVRDERVMAVVPGEGGFRVTLEGGSHVLAQRIVLAMGVIDEPLDVPGMREAWGHSVFQCPHCHGWERRDQAWGVLIPSAAMADSPLILRGWTANVVAFTHGTFEAPADLQRRFAEAGVKLETQPVRRLIVEPGGGLRGVELLDGAVIPLDVLFTMPKQHLPPLVKTLGLALTDAGFVRVNEQQETSVPGIFAAGDITTFAQAAVIASAAGAMAGWMMTHGLNLHGRRRAA
jgi:thioredoxin reductase